MQNIAKRTVISNTTILLILVLTLIFITFTFGLMFQDVEVLFASEIEKDEYKSIKVVLDNNYPPYIFMDKDGNPQGIIADQWSLWEKKTGIKVSLYPMPWETAQVEMQNGNYDVIDTMFKNADRELLYNFSKPYAKIDVPIFFNKNISGISDVKSLIGFNIAVKKGDYAITFLQSKGITNLTYYESYEDIIKEAKSKKNHIFVADFPPAQYFLYKEDIEELFKYTKPLYSGEFHRAVKKGNLKLLTAIENGFNKISSDEYNAIDTKWFGQPLIMSSLVKILLYSLLIVVLLFMILIGLNLTLKVQVAKKTKELASASNSLKESEEKYRLITENASDVIWVYNTQIKKFTYMSPSVFYLRGLTPEEALNQSIEEAVEKESYPIVMQELSSGILEFRNNPIQYNNKKLEIIQPCKDGRKIWTEVSARFRFNNFDEIELVGITRDITQRKKDEEEIIFISNHDQLTNLYNRRYFETSLKKYDCKENLPLTIIMGDVNGLKLVNDSFGHHMGDELLVKVADVIRKVIREEDVAARLGGDEFIIIMPNTSSDEALKVIRNLRQISSREKVGAIDVSVSFGFETKVNESQDISEVLKSTEDYMYMYKLSESTSMRSKTIHLIMNTLYEKNNREMLHSMRVSEICEKFAQILDFDKTVVNQIRLAGLMHDIGKIVIDDKILNKSSRLDNDELSEIRRHPETGYRILSSCNEFSEISNYVLEHQERWDGSGYPRNLKEEEISIGARIITIADSYDAMTSHRSYGTILSDDEAVVEIINNSGSQFDPFYARIFVEKVLHKEW